MGRPPLTKVLILAFVIQLGNLLADDLGRQDGQRLAVAAQSHDLLGYESRACAAQPIHHVNFIGDTLAIEDAAFVSIEACRQRASRYRRALAKPGKLRQRLQGARETAK